MEATNLKQGLVVAYFKEVADIHPTLVIVHHFNKRYVYFYAYPVLAGYELQRLSLSVFCNRYNHSVATIHPYFQNRPLHQDIGTVQPIPSSPLTRSAIKSISHSKPRLIIINNKKLEEPDSQKLLETLFYTQKGHFTLESAFSHRQFTYRISKSIFFTPEGQRFVYFLYLLSNFSTKTKWNNRYSYVGMIDDSGFHFTEKSQINKDDLAFKAFHYVYNKLRKSQIPPDVIIYNSTITKPPKSSTSKKLKEHE